jgi:hypothetical protein
MLISIPLINMLRTQGSGFKSTNVLSDESYHCACYTCVDDTDLIHNGTLQSTSQQVFDDMQSMLDHWEGGLRAIGGALVPDKRSYWYAMDFDWDPQKYIWTYKTKAELPGILYLKNHLQQVEVLEQLEVHKTRETLGVFAAVNGNQKAQKQALANKVQIWAKKITTEQLLTRIETWLSLHLGIAKSLRYPLTATCLSKQDCHKLQKPLLKAAFKSLGFPSTFPHTIAFAPTEIMGLGFPNFWNAQATDHLMALMKHSDSLQDDTNPNVTGCLQRYALTNLCMALELPGFPFGHSYKKLHLCTTLVWLHTAWQFCNELQLVLQDTLPQLKLKRRYDQFIMQAFLDHG